MEIKPNLNVVTLLPGTTFTPAIDTRGYISWTNDNGLKNPTPVCVMGQKGDPGEKGNAGEKGDKGDSGLEKELIIDLNNNVFSNDFRKSKVLVQKVGKLVIVNGFGIVGSNGFNKNDIIFNIPDYLRPNVTLNVSTTNAYGNYTFNIDVNGDVVFLTGTEQSSGRNLSFNFSYNLIDVRP